MTREEKLAFCHYYKALDDQEDVRDFNWDTEMRWVEGVLDKFIPGYIDVYKQYVKDMFDDDGIHIELKAILFYRANKWYVQYSMDRFLRVYKEYIQFKK